MSLSSRASICPKVAVSILTQEKVQQQRHIWICSCVPGCSLVSSLHVGSLHTTMYGFSRSWGCRLQGFWGHLHRLVSCDFLTHLFMTWQWNISKELQKIPLNFLKKKTCLKNTLMETPNPLLEALSVVGCTPVMLNAFLSQTTQWRACSVDHSKDHRLSHGHLTHVPNSPGLQPGVFLRFYLECLWYILSSRLQQDVLVS